MQIQVPDRSLMLIKTIDESEISGRVAFATSDRTHVDEHFGTATSFIVFALVQDSWHLLRAVEYGATERGHNENKLITRIAALNDCNAVYSNAVGPSAIKQLLTQKIQPMVVEPGSSIKALLKEINQDRKTAKSGWLSQLNPNEDEESAKSQHERMMDLLDEDWE